MKKDDVFFEFIDRMRRYVFSYLKMVKSEPKFLSIFVIATNLESIFLPTRSPYWMAFFFFFNLLAGFYPLLQTGLKIEKAFSSIDLNFDKGYGKPKWIIKGDKPLLLDAIYINNGGYSIADFEAHRDRIAARLNMPISSITHPNIGINELRIEVQKTFVPSSFHYSDIDFLKVKADEFVLGMSDKGLEKLDYNLMIHMLVAGQTGSGKTMFLKQFITTVLTHSKHPYVALIDMKGGIDFQQFDGIPNFDCVTDENIASKTLDACIDFFEIRKAYLKSKKKEKWSELSIKGLMNEKTFNELPIGPVFIVVDELAELTSQSPSKSNPIEKKLSKLARLARFTGIHLILGTQRPEKSVINMQVKDNLPTRICFAVPSVAASTLVVNNMSASTLGNHPGRAVLSQFKNTIIQAPFITNEEISNKTILLKQKNANASQRSLKALIDGIAKKDKEESIDEYET